MVYLVGAGPGDPGLITVKALDVLRQADVVLYDKLVDPSLLFEVKSGCLLVDVGKRAGVHEKNQDEITALLVRYGRQDKTVVRLKGGDPFLFGRGAEEAEHLTEEGIPYVVIPGVSALNAVTTCAGIPITHRDWSSSFAVATGHGARGKESDPVRWDKLAQGVDTVVVFMGVGNLKKIIRGMLDGGLNPETPAALIVNGCLPSQRVVTGTVGTIADIARHENVTPPALLVTGKTVALHSKLNRHHPGLLAGITIGITRPFAQSKSFGDMLSSIGAWPVFMPTILTADTNDTPEAERVMGRLETYDYLVFSSTNGVDSFFRALYRKGGDARSLAGKKTAVIGPVTGETLAAHGIRADLTAETFVAEGLIETLLSADSVAGKKVLLVRSDIGRDTLRDGLRKAGAEVDQAAFYSTRTAPLKPVVIEALKAGSIDMITFTSSSTVEGFFSQVPADGLSRGVRIASIGPQTSRTVERYGRTPDIEAAEYTTRGLAGAIESFFRTGAGGA